MSSASSPAAGPLLVGIGDLHGHLPALEQLLGALDGRHGILDGEGLRAGVTIVLTGDYIDRGSQGLAVIDRLRRLGAGAGRLVTLMGNHELLALAHLDDARALLEGGVPDPVRAYERATVHGRNGGDAFLLEFGATPEEALDGYVRRMSADGDVGAWLRALHPAWVGKVGGKRVLFVHGDVPPGLRSQVAFQENLEQVRRRVRLTSADAGGTERKWGEGPFDEDGLFWSRDFLALSPTDERAARAICRRLGVDFIVTGHTIHDRVRAYGGQIFDIDVGMSPPCGGNAPTALVFAEDGVRTLTVGSTVRSARVVS